MEAEVYRDEHACVSDCLSVCPRTYLWNYALNLYQFYIECNAYYETPYNRF